MRTKFVVAALMLTLLGNLPGAFAADPPEKWFVVQDAVNTQSSFMLRVEVDRPDRTYYVGEQMTVTVKAEKDCYLYLVYYGASNQVACLFPNEYQKENFIRAGQPVTVPAPDAKFQFTCSPPCGKEYLQVIGTLQPTDIFKGKVLNKSFATVLDTADLKDMKVELKKGKPQDWAEARIDILTVEGSRQPPPPGRQPSQYGKSKRFAVCVGISEFKSPQVPPLHVSHKDAQRMAQALQEQCQVSDVTLLINSQATRAAIEKAIFQDLVQKSKPGDTVFIYFSCHGGRTADTNGDEQDGLDEYIVPHDGELGKPDTMILDDVFARWMQELDGRKIAIILDNCYSGGSSKGMKGLGDNQTVSGSLDFLDGEMKRAKDLGQANTMVLAASQANQVAWEMPENDGDGSVLTNYSLAALKDSRTDANGDGHISVGELYKTIKTPVEEYVRKTFNADQNPVLLDNANDGIYCKP
jgi:hypothetical protein